MSAKSLDTHGRWRSLTIAFRISPEDNEQLNRLAQLSGLTKQEYITQRLLCPNNGLKRPVARTFKATVTAK